MRARDIEKGFTYVTKQGFEYKVTDIGDTVDHKGRITGHTVDYIADYPGHRGEARKPHCRADMDKFAARVVRMKAVVNREAS